MVNTTRIEESFSNALAPFGLLGLDETQALSAGALPAALCQPGTAANFVDVAPRVEPVDLARVWEMLATGRAVAVESGCTDERCWLLVEPRSTECHPGLASASDLAILGRVLRGEAQKVVAHEIGASLSTVTTACSRGLRAMGIVSRPSRAPLMMMLAAHAVAGRARLRANESTIHWGQRELRMLEAEHPGATTRGTLTEAERSVVRRLLDGQSHQEIGSARGTTGRTVANQMAGVYRKLKVSGRGALVAALVQTR